jgi:hypothetical protein
LPAAAVVFSVPQPANRAMDATKRKQRPNHLVAAAAERFADLMKMIDSDPLLQRTDPDLGRGTGEKHELLY